MPKTCNKPVHVKGYKLALFLFSACCLQLYLQRGWTSRHLLPPTILQMPLHTIPQPWFCHTCILHSLCWLYQVMPAMELEYGQGIGADLGNNPKSLCTKKAVGQMGQYQNFCPSTALASGCQFSLFRPCFLEQAQWNDSVHSSVCSASISMSRTTFLKHTWGGHQVPLMPTSLRREVWHPSHTSSPTD